MFKLIVSAFGLFIAAFIAVHAATNPASTTAAATNPASTTAAVPAVGSTPLASINDPAEQARIRAQRERVELDQALRKPGQKFERRMSEIDADYRQRMHQIDRDYERRKAERQIEAMQRASVPPVKTTITYTSRTRVYFPR